MKKTILGLLMAALILTSAPAVWANHGGAHGGHCSLSGGQSMGSGHGESKGGGCPIAAKFFKKAEMMLENQTELGLSEEQVTTIKSLKMDMEKRSIRQAADMKIGMLDMEAKLKEQNVDVEGLNAMIDQGMAAWAKSAKETVQSYAQLKGLLSAEQWTKLKALHQSGKH